MQKTLQVPIDTQLLRFIDHWRVDTGQTKKMAIDRLLRIGLATALTPPPGDTVDPERQLDNLVEEDWRGGWVDATKEALKRRLETEAN